MWVDRTHHVTLSYDFDHKFSRSKFEKAVSLGWGGRLTWNEKDVSRYKVGPSFWLRPLIPPMTLALNLKVRFWEKKLYLGNGRVDGHRTKRTWVDRMLNPPCNIELWPWTWIFKVKFRKKKTICNPVVGWPFDMERKGCVSIRIRTHFVTWTFTSAVTLTLNFQDQI